MKTSSITAPSLLAACICFANGPAAAADAIEPVVVKATAHFGFDSAAISEADRKAMLAEVGKMTGVTWQTVTATGYTDSVGMQAYNARLAQRRARAVKAYLVKNGIGPSMVETRALGDAAPTAPNTTEEGRAQNRRTEIEFRGVRSPPN